MLSTPSARGRNAKPNPPPCLNRAVLPPRRRRRHPAHHGSCIYPVLPFTAARVWAQLGLGSIEGAAASGQLHRPRLGPGPARRPDSVPSAPSSPEPTKKLAEQMTQMESEKNAPIGNANAAHDTTVQRKHRVQRNSHRLRHSRHRRRAARRRVRDLPWQKASLASLSTKPPARLRSTIPSHFDPAAGPRTSIARRTGRRSAGRRLFRHRTTGSAPRPLSHVEAEPSGIFAGAPADQSPQITIRRTLPKSSSASLKSSSASAYPKADKLLRLEVDPRPRKAANPDHGIDGVVHPRRPHRSRRIVVITNLAPRKMRGLESHGMLLAASSEGGKPRTTPPFSTATTCPSGSRLK